jgi:hypothetical protein
MEEILSQRGDYVITSIGNNFGLYKGDTLEYDTHILYSNELWVLEEEMEKLTSKYNAPEQLRLFP